MRCACRVVAGGRGGGCVCSGAGGPAIGAQGAAAPWCWMPRVTAGGLWNLIRSLTQATRGRTALSQVRRAVSVVAGCGAVGSWEHDQDSPW